MRIPPEITGVSLVLLGNFNPSIFTPAWFGWHGLLPENTVNIAELQTAQPQITTFQADWLHLQVLPNRFLISTAQPPFVRLRDLTIRIFQEQLPHTRLGAMGINREIHFLFNALEERDRLGRTLAPIAPWGAWAGQLGPDGRHGGMTSITMTQVGIKDRPPGGQLNVTVQPSNRVGKEGTGVFVQVNDHYAIEDPESQTATSEIVSLLETHFDDSLRHADQIIDHIMSLRES